MKYLFINPFQEPTSGVSSYIESAADLLKSSFDVEILQNTKGLSPAAFQKELFETVTTQYGKTEVVIESPETRAATLLLDRSYPVHTRLHTPIAVCHRIEGREVDQNRFSNEMRVITQAQQVSAPSYGIVDALRGDISLSRSHVYKNPIREDVSFGPETSRKIDVLYVGRYQKLKGTPYLAPILTRLPNGLDVQVIGGGPLPLSEGYDEKIKFHGFVPGQERFEIMAQSKVVIVPSLFENCSMVILEAIRAGCHVVTWDVGGNSEFSRQFVTTVEFDDTASFSAAVMQALEKVAPKASDVGDFLHRQNLDFVSGTKMLVRALSGASKKIYQSSFAPQERESIDKSLVSPAISPSSDLETFFSKKRVFGFTISNEHIEEMWAPIVNYLGVEHRYVCRRPLGFHSKFGHPQYVDQTKFSQYDRIKHWPRLVDELQSFNPDVVLFHNGLHPSYQDTLNRIRRHIDVPFVYTELGWLPQHGNIYLDRFGVNGNSSIARMSYDGMVRSKRKDQEEIKETKVKPDVLVLLQLDNDTNMIVNSPNFKSATTFLDYVIKKVGPNKKIHVKPHPLDRNNGRFENGKPKNVHIVEEGVSLEELFLQVGHVIAINSTACIEALSYPVNVYQAGNSILDNKGIAISLIDGKLELQDSLYGSMAKREEFLKALRDRQINVLELGRTPPISEIDSLENGFSPLVEALLMSRISRRPPVATKKNAAPKPAISSKSHLVEKTPIRTGSYRQRKIRKLISNPELFFRDSRYRVIRPLSGLFPEK